MGKAIVIADDKGIKGILCIEAIGGRLTDGSRRNPQWLRLLLGHRGRFGFIALFKTDFQLAPTFLLGSAGDQGTIVFFKPIGKNIFRDAQNQTLFFQADGNDVGNPHGKCGRVHFLF